MPNSRAFDYRLWVTLLVSFGFAFLLNKLLPTFAEKPLYILAIPFGLLFFAALVIKPKWILAALLLSRPLLDNVLNMTKSDVGGGQGVGLGAVINLSIIVLGIFLYFYYGNFPRRDKVVLAWFIYLFFMFLSVCYSPFRIAALKLYFNYLTYFCIYLLPFFIIKTKEDFVFWLKVLGCSFILPVIFANVDMLHGGRFASADAGNRVEGTFTHPNILAFYLVLGITVFFYILNSRCFRLKPVTLWLIRLFMLNMLVLLVATKTRNAWIACFWIFFIYGLLKDRKLLIVLLLLIPATLSVPTVRERVLTVTSADGQASDYEGMNSMEWRLHMWSSSFPMIKQKPVQGYGLASFLPMSGEFSDVGANGAHNAFIQTLFETGIVGLLSFAFLYLTPMMVFFHDMRKSVDPKQAQLWALMVAYVLSYILICFGDNLLYYLVFNWYVWFFIGLMMVWRRLSHE